MKRRIGVVLSLVACMPLLASTTLVTPALAQGRGAPAGKGPKPPPAPAAPVDLIAKGRTLFDDQQYEESIQALSAALLRPTNTKADRVEIYRLLALNYITLNRKEEAESAVRGLLGIQPDYQLPQNESPRFRDFFAQARTKWEADGRPGLEKPDVKPAILKHTPPTQADHDKNLELRGSLEDPERRTRAVKFFYRRGTSGDFDSTDAELALGSVRVEVPASSVKPPVLDYYFEMQDAKGGVVGMRGDASSPIRIPVSQPSKGWILPVAIGGGVLGAAAIVGGLALAGVFKSKALPPSGPGNGTVSVSIGEASR